MRRVLAIAVAATLIAGLGHVPAYGHEQTATARWEPRIRRPAKAHELALKPRRADPTANRNMTRPDRVEWPPASLTEISTDAAGQRQAPQRLRVQTFDRAVSRRVGVNGPVMQVRSGRGQLKINYAPFEHAYGGDWGPRLRMVALPACALSTPELARCRTSTPLRSTNDTQNRTVSAAVEPGAIVALEAGDASAQGDYKATKLSPSSSWTVDLSSGGFSWTYPIRPPDVPGKLTPEVAIGYSSQSTDGRNSATNNQGSWVGEGFGYEPGFIERRYRPCADDGHAGSAEQCWAFHNGTIVLGGRSGQLVKVDDNLWKLSNDDGSKVERLSGAANGDGDGEYWKLTTTDGTQMFFGLNRLPGYQPGKEETDSTWTLPIFGDDDGEPCNSGSGFASSFCDQAWRWNLDYVVDSRGNAISYFYDKEINHYAKRADTTVNGTPYVRSGYLTRIDYGQRDGQVYTTSAPARVVFTVAERCLPSGSVDCDPEDLDDSTKSSWPDVPTDLICAPDIKCKAIQAATTFFTRKRLTRIETQVRGAEDWLPVESWNLTHEWKENHDASRTLWLRRLVHSGHWGGSTISKPPVEFDAIEMPNRIDTPSDFVGALTRYRLAAVYTDTGAKLSVVYAPEDCAAGSLPTPGSSMKRCYPVRWNPFGGAESNEIIDWFNKYVVAKVIQEDLVGGNPNMEWHNEYVGGAAWVKARPDGITKDKYLSWTDWRGYQQVIVRSGDGQSMPGKVTHAFLRGLGGSVSDSTGRSHSDSEGLAGRELETTVYNGDAVVSKTINEPWRRVTHTQTEKWGTREATIVRTGVVRGLVALPGDRWQESKTRVEYDPTWGRPVTTEELSDAGNRCTRTWYADNPAKHLYAHVSRTQTVAVRCDQTPDLTTDLLTDTRTSYDLAAPGDAPVKGVPTRNETVDKYDETVRYLTEFEATSVDEYGRTLLVKDPLGKVTRLEYTDTNGLTTQTRSTNPLGHATTTIQDPAYGLPTTIVDPNGKRQDRAYDQFGRLTAVWLPNRSKAAGATPSVRHSYKANVVTTETLKTGDTYRVSHELYDGMLRPRQTQTAAPDGWLLGDTMHNGIGKVALVNAPHHATGAAGDRPLLVPETDVDGQKRYAYDGAGRLTTETDAVAGVARWSTTTAYGGDRVTTTPPAGGISTVRVLDAQGNTIELHQDGEVTRYAYWPNGLVKTVTNPLGTSWSIGYDQRGRRTTTRDPDAGTAHYTYDAAGNVTSVTDARGIKLSHKYDDLGRRIETWQGEIDTGTKLSASKYDTKALGQLYYTARFTASGTYYISNETLDALYRPLTTRYWIPGKDIGSTQQHALFDYTYQYNHDGTLQSVGLPAAGDLPAESIVTTYDDWMRPTSLTGMSSYVTDTSYNPVGQLLQAQLHSGGTGKKVNLVWEYDRGTGNVTRSGLYREGNAAWDKDARYTYDPAGNITSIVDAPTGGQRDVQCFRYDGLRRMKEAWATADTCDSGPESVGGPAPYHHSWTFDAAGNRKTETIHGDTDAVHTYVYSPTQPHVVTDVTQPGAPALEYEYDPAGYTISRPGQTLTWDAEGHLATSKPDGGQPTSYVYDTSGRRLVRKEPNATTFYLPGMELRLAAGALTATRFYGFLGHGVAVRTGGGLSFQAGDQHGTTTHSVDADTGAIQTRRTTPFGGGRGGAPTAWPDQRGFVGGTQDGSGLTNIGVREYDPALGRFISDDPITVLTEPQQLHGYSYSNANPVTMSDPSGACLPELCGSPDELLPQEERDAAQCVLNKATCGGPPRHDPNRIVSMTRYPHGTVMVILANGTVVINGYVIPRGVKDPDALGRRVDDRIKARGGIDDFRSLGELYWFTAAAVERACDPEICTLVAYEKAKQDRQWHMENVIAPTMGICFGGGTGMGLAPRIGAGAGFSVCLVGDGADGISLVISGSVASGVMGDGGGGGIGPMISNGTAQDLRGHFYQGSVTGGSGDFGATVSHSYTAGHEITVDSVLLGPAIGGSVSWGPGWTCVIGISKPSFGC